LDVWIVEVFHDLCDNYKRAKFIGTKGVGESLEAVMKDWFTSYAEGAWCIYIKINNKKIRTLWLKWDSWVV
jgi:hypothetical protein